MEDVPLQAESEEIFVKSIVEMHRALVYRIYRPLGLVVRGRLVKRQVLLCSAAEIDWISGSSKQQNLTNIDTEHTDFIFCGMG